MKKKANQSGRPTGTGRTGRPRIYGERVMWTVLLPLDLAARVEKRREKTGHSQSAAVEEALRGWLGRR